jgi:hypothetical protein
MSSSLFTPMMMADDSVSITVHTTKCDSSVSARISKGQLAGAVSAKKGNCVVARKNVKKLEKLIEFHSF